jgi:flagellar biosynthesis/type III secretory pathway M-ring protein FliF/YscJ
MEDQEVPAGRDFKYKISATDEDSEDLPDLKYYLVEAPDGMTISEETGMIRWTPDDDQVMLHTVTVMVTDGIENSTATFEIEVTEGESSSSSLLIIIAVVVIVVILVALGVFFFIKQKKKMDEEALKRGEEERAALEKDKEEDVLGYEDLYGAPAPVIEDEDMTTEELRDSVHDQIEELEQMDTEE